MDISDAMLSTTIGAAINLIFNELAEILREIRHKHREEKEEKETKKPPDKKKQAHSKDDVMRWALKARIDAQTETEIKGLIEIIEIHKQNRIRSQKIIAKMGGDVFAMPPQMAALNEAEESIQKYSRALIGKIERLYGSNISIDVD
jgi:hypothetical protein